LLIRELISKSSINILKLFNPNAIMSKKDVLIIKNLTIREKLKIIYGYIVAVVKQFLCAFLVKLTRNDFF